MSQSYSPSVVWGGNAEIKDNIFYTKEGGALTKNALDLDGQCNYIIEGNIFYGSQSTESKKMNKCDPLKYSLELILTLIKQDIIRKTGAIIHQNMEIM